MTELAPRRVALVTGSSRGIGRAVLERLAVDHDCVVHCRQNRADAELVADGVAQRGARSIIVQGDLADPEVRRSIIASIESDFGRLDTFVASAASTKFAPLLRCESRHVERTLSTVVTSFLDLSRATSRLMGDDGRIVAISGLDSRFAQAGHGLLGAAKAAIEALVRSLAVELAPRGATVNAIVPGAIETQSLGSYFGDDADARRAMVRGTPVGRLGTPEEVADAVSFLCARSSRFITGQTLVVDGGAAAEGGQWSSFRTLWDEPTP
jgi:enoyl-[acyl-carrier protein] reductase III